MGYLIAKLWIYLLIAFVVGCYVGWSRHAARRI